MALTINILDCASIAAAMYFCLGLPLALRVAERRLALLLAPGLGWAAHSVLALPIFFVIGMSWLTVGAVFAVPIVAAFIAIWRERSRRSEGSRDAPTTIVTLIGAVLLALAVAAAVLPKVSADGVTLAAPIFDHSKIAMIEEIARMGVPPANPFYGGPGSPAWLAYYYLWHFSAAEISVLTGASGWEADATLTWFTAFASLAAMIGLATWLSGRASSAIWVLVLAATASVRPLLYALFGVAAVENIASYQSGFGGWLFQTSWAPQHTTSALCAVLSIFLIVRLAEQRSVMTALTLALTMAASFESSIWIGGLALPVSAAVVSVFSLVGCQPARRSQLFVYLGAAAVLAVLLMAPVLFDELRLSALRPGSAPIALMPYQVLGEGVAGSITAVLNLPAYWLIFLVVEFPAFYLVGVISLCALLKDRTVTGDRKAAVMALALSLSASLGVAWLLLSTLADNNDLGWRAVLPAVMLLIVFSAAGLSRLMDRPRSLVTAGALALVLLGIPDGAMLIAKNVLAAPQQASKVFATSPALWEAVRRHAGPDERIANNPLFLERMTPWPVNISWALMSNRRSCYASAALAGPFTALSEAQNEKIGAQFTRVFAGDAAADDVAQLATVYHCDVAVITPQDGAWSRDPFASSPIYRLAEGNEDWRIYKLAKLSAR